MGAYQSPTAIESPFFIVDADEEPSRPILSEQIAELSVTSFGMDTYADYLSLNAVDRHLARQVEISARGFATEVAGFLHGGDPIPLRSGRSAPSPSARGGRYFPDTAGSSSIDPKIAIPLESELSEELAASGSRRSAEDLLRDFQFRTCCLNMVVELDHPSVWRVDMARFRFHFPTPPTSIITYAPKAEIIKIDVLKTGSTTISPSFTVSWGAGAGASIGTPFTRKRGWTTHYSTSVEKLQGYQTVTSPDEFVLNWAMYYDKATAPPDSDKGYAMIASSLAIVQFPKGRTDPTVNVTFEGEANRIKLPTFKPCPIRDPFVRSFSLEPNC